MDRRRRQRLLWLVGLSLASGGCELVSGLVELDFTGGGGVGGAGAEGAADALSASTGTGPSGGAGGAGASGGAGGDGGGAPTPIDELFVGSGRHTCVRRGAEFLCWGQTLDASPDILTPQPATFPAGTVEVAPNDPFCVRTNAGAVYCWGENDLGQLGIGNTSPQPRPGQPVGLASPALRIASRAGWACAIESTAPASLTCWGSNGAGQLFLPDDNAPHPTPMTVALPTPVAAVAQMDVAPLHACARRGTEVVCWGHNSGGALGINSAVSLPMAPGPLATVDPVAEVAVTDGGGCVITTTGEGQCWGTYWTVDGTVAAEPAFDGAQGLESGGHICAVKNGEAVCVGANNHFQLGGNDMFALTAVTALPDEVVQVGAGYDHTCALTSAGEVYCWGNNFGGAVGNGAPTNLDFFEPQLVTFPE